jgi:hypothetical protein
VLRYLTHIRDWYRDPFRKRPNWAEKTILALTVAIVLIYRGQLKEMHGAGQQTTDLVASANIQSSAACEIACAATAMREQAQLAAKNFQQSADSAIAQLKRSADNSETAMRTASENAQKALDVSIDASRLDERPWVVSQRWVMSNEPEENKMPTIQIWAIDTGKTPALDVIPLTQVSITDELSPPPLGQTTEAPKSIGMLAPGAGGVSFTTEAPRYLKPAIDAYNAGNARFYVRAKVTYSDVSKIEHWTTICIFHMHGHPLDEFNYCSDGNDVDRNTK